MFSLEFPLLVSHPTTKRPADQAPKFPAKRRKRVLPEYEDNSWMDNFLFLDIESSSFETVSLSQHSVCSSDQIKKALDDSSKEITTNNGYIDDSKLQTETLHKHLRNRAGVISPFQLAADVPEPNVVSPLFSPKESVAQHHVPVVEQIPSVDSSIAFSISKLKNSKEPTLLTLTSYPYRIIYCNEAFSRLSGRKTPEIGDSVFDAFDIEGRILRPCLTTYPTLEGYLDEKIALVPSFTDEQDNQYWIRCGVHADPIKKHDGSNELLYFAVRFSPLQSPPSSS